MYLYLYKAWFNNALKNNTIKCKKLATIVSGKKNVARPFIRRKQVSTSAEMKQQHTLLVLTCFCLMKGHDKFFQPKTMVRSFLHFMVLLRKVLFNQLLMCCWWYLMASLKSLFSLVLKCHSVFHATLAANLSWQWSTLPFLPKQGKYFGNCCEWYYWTCSRKITIFVW